MAPTEGGFWRSLKLCSHSCAATGEARTGATCPQQVGLYRGLQEKTRGRQPRVLWPCLAGVDSGKVGSGESALSTSLVQLPVWTCPLSPACAALEPRTFLQSPHWCPCSPCPPAPGVLPSPSNLLCVLWVEKLPDGPVLTPQGRSPTWLFSRCLCSVGVRSGPCVPREGDWEGHSKLSSELS